MLRRTNRFSTITAWMGFQDCLALGQRETERRESNAFSLETSNLVHLLLVAVTASPELERVKPTHCSHQTEHPDRRNVRQQTDMPLACP